MAYLKIKDIDIYYEIHGKGYPLVLIAGLASSCDAFRSIINELARYYKVLVFDNRGAGRTTVTDEPYTISQMTGDTYSLMSELGIRKAHILGVSMGGFIAQELAIHHPETVNRLILSNTAALSDNRLVGLLKSFCMMYEQNVSTKIINRLFAYFCYTKKFLSNKEDFELLMEFVDNYPYPQSPEGFINQVEACVNHDSTGRLNLIESETLVVSGQEDILILPEDSEEMLKYLRHAKYVCMESSAHCPMLENRREYLDIIMKFLY